MPDLEFVTTAGHTTVVTTTAVNRFRAEFRGQLLEPGHETYDQARKVRNGMVDKRPALIARCADTRDVIATTCGPHRHAAVCRDAEPAGSGVAGRTALLQQSPDCPGMMAWARECWEALRPYADRAVYVNALEDLSDEGQQRVREAYGANYDRLVRLKAEYDPTNFFRLNQNITPAAHTTV